MKNPKGINIDSVVKSFEKSQGDGDEQRIDKIYRDYKGYHRNQQLNPLGSSPKAWNKPPYTDEEKALYAGVHLHSESSPFGLHSHIPGGQLSGGHTHSPSNTMGRHHHQDGTQDVIDTDGDHLHDENFPDGCHKHNRFNFG